jgi:hypothetical protein
MMRQVCLLVLAAGLVTGSAGAAAQGARDPLTVSLRQQFDDIARMLKEMSEKLSVEKYDYRPAAHVRTFGGNIGHAADHQFERCALIKGEANPNRQSLEKLADKTALVKGLIAANNYCDSVLKNATDTWLVQQIGDGKDRASRAAMVGEIIRHSTELYGMNTMYTRLMNPPAASGPAGARRDR